MCSIDFGFNMTEVKLQSLSLIPTPHFGHHLICKVDYFQKKKKKNPKKTWLWFSKLFFFRKCHVKPISELTQFPSSRGKFVLWSKINTQIICVWKYAAFHFIYRPARKQIKTILLPKQRYFLVLFNLNVQRPKIYSFLHPKEATGL